eukprot:gene7399-11723_t
MFASELAQILGVCAPKVRLIQQGKSKEYDDITKKIEELADPTKTFSRPFFMIMEFVDNSHELGDIDEKCLLSENVLKDIGRIVIFDVILNNWDRMPTGILWEHEGNPNNLIINSKLMHCFAIDQATCEFQNSDIHKSMKNT